MTVASLALVFWPLLKSGVSGEEFSREATNHSHEVEVYKDQLKEVENDLKQGMLTKDEAEAAKLEISRRMLASVEALEKSVAITEKSAKPKKTSSKSSKKMLKGKAAKLQFIVDRWDRLSQRHQHSVLISGVGVTLMALGLYAGLGSPSSEDQPYAKRFANKATAPLKKKMATLEALVEKNPKDGKSWEKLAALYMNASSFHKAAFSFRQAMKSLGENTSRLTGFAEATIMVNKGKVTEPSRLAYQRALKLDPELVEPRIRLAMGMEQRGDIKNAVKAYRDSLKRSRKNAPWVPFLEKRLAALTGKPVKRPLTAEEKKIEALIAKVEVSLKKNPKAGRGWDVIAPVYLSRGHYKKALNAFEKAIALLGESGKRFSGMGEAITLLNEGTITPKAEAYFKKALKFDTDLVEPRIRLAMGLEQKGSWKEARKEYQYIIDKGGKNAPWSPIIEERLKIVTAQLNGTVSKGPSAEQVRDAQSMSGTDRQAFINQMVARLAGRLEKNGNDLGGWLKLMNAYNVQGKKQKIAEAYSKASKIFGSDAAAMAQLNASAQRFGVASNAVSQAPMIKKGPNAEQVKSAMSMSGTDRQAFINQMVARLAGRLDKNGNDLGGWMKLMRVYMVQGRKAEAQTALAKARKIFAGNNQALGQLGGAAQALGL